MKGGKGKCRRDEWCILSLVSTAVSFTVFLWSPLGVMPKFSWTTEVKNDSSCKRAVEICFENMRSCRNILFVIHLNHNEIRGDATAQMTNIPRNFSCFFSPLGPSFLPLERESKSATAGMLKGGKSDATCDEATCEKVISLLRAWRISDKEKEGNTFPTFHGDLHGGDSF